MTFLKKMSQRLHVLGRELFSNENEIISKPIHKNANIMTNEQDHSTDQSALHDGQADWNEVKNTLQNLHQSIASSPSMEDSGETAMNQTQELNRATSDPRSASYTFGTLESKLATLEERVNGLELVLHEHIARPNELQQKKQILPEQLHSKWNDLENHIVHLLHHSTPSKGLGYEAGHHPLSGFMSELKGGVERISHKLETIATTNATHLVGDLHSDIDRTLDHITQHKEHLVQQYREAMDTLTAHHQHLIQVKEQLSSVHKPPITI